MWSTRLTVPFEKVTVKISPFEPVYPQISIFPERPFSTRSAFPTAFSTWAGVDPTLTNDFKVASAGLTGFEAHAPENANAQITRAEYKRTWANYQILPAVSFSFCTLGGEKVRRSSRSLARGKCQCDLPIYP